MLFLNKKGPRLKCVHLGWLPQGGEETPESWFWEFATDVHRRPIFLDNYFTVVFAKKTVKKCLLWQEVGHLLCRHLLVKKNRPIFRGKPNRKRNIALLRTPHFGEGKIDRISCNGLLDGRTHLTLRETESTEKGVVGNTHASCFGCTESLPAVFTLSHQQKGPFCKKNKNRPFQKLKCVQLG